MSPAPSPFRRRRPTSVHRLVWLVALLATLVPLSPDAAPAQSACTNGPFTASFGSTLAQQFPNQRVTASVYDTRTGCWYHLHPGTQMTTASVVKAQFLAGVLLRAQDQRRGMTDWERTRVHPMMTYSHNPPANDLFSSLGGAPGMEHLDTRFGLTATGHTSQWGVTITTAEDRTRLALALLHGGGPLGAAARSQAWGIMSNVHPTQRWGISAGVPAGWSVALKNGFYPMSGTPRWRIGSTGFVRHDVTGLGYAVTIMTDHNPDHAAGQRLVEQVSRQIAATLAGTPGASRLVDRAVCVAARVGESWSSVAARVGTNDVAGVQRVAGGTANPIGGMRACNPIVYDPNGQTAKFVGAAFRTLMGRSASADELRSHTVFIDSGARSRDQFTQILAQSMEWTSRTISQLYRTALGREPDGTGLRYWRDQVVAGLRITDVGAYFYASHEYFVRSGGTNQAFVKGLYEDILHRPAEGSGHDYWLRVLRAGHSRETVAASFYASIESRRDRVARTYRSVLGRAPDATGHAYWAGQLLAHDDIDLATWLAASTEFFNRAQR